MFPTKLIPMGQADFEFLGRALVEFIAKTLLVLAAAAISAGVGLFTLLMMNAGLPMSVKIGWISFTLIGLLMVIAMQFAFRRFAVAETIE